MKINKINIWILESIKLFNKMNDWRRWLFFFLLRSMVILLFAWKWKVSKYIKYVVKNTHETSSQKIFRRTYFVCIWIRILYETVRKSFFYFRCSSNITVWYIWEYQIIQFQLENFFFNIYKIKTSTWKCVIFKNNYYDKNCWRNKSRF